MTNASSRPATPSMAPDVGLFSQLFTAQGRANRAKYWRTVLLLVAVNLVVFGAIYFMPEPLQTPLVIVSVVVWVVTAVIGILVSIRRLHDRDKSGHWLWLFMLVPGVLNGIGNAVSWGEAGPVPAAIALGLIGFAISIWAFVELGCLRGTSGANRFGPDPLQGAT